MKRSLVGKGCLLSVCFALMSSFVSAQNHFTYKALLDTIAQSGFYNISLSPVVMAKCKKEGDDIRIKDEKGNEAPYLLYTETAQPNEETFTEFPLSFSDDRKTIYINNILPSSLDKLFLLIKNSEAQRIATLSGSDDQIHWFVIKENIVLQSEYAADSDAFVQSVSFPKSSYKYLRITMPGKNMLPLNISKAGVYRHSFSSDVYDTVPSPRITQKDSSNKYSYIWLSFDDNYQIDKLIPFLAGAKYYKRLIAVYDKNTINPSLFTDTLSSAKQSGLDFHAKTSRLLLVVDNRDNAPLSLMRVTALQLHTSVTAYLEKDKKYALCFGDPDAIAPSYDLQYFDDSIGSNIMSLKIRNLEKINSHTAIETKQSDRNKWILWSIITAVLLLLIYFSLRMIRDINNKKDNNISA